MVNYTTSELTPLIMKGAGVRIQGIALSRFAIHMNRP